MDRINAKIYYEISTGDVLTITSEMQGCVEETTKEQDIEIYEQLKNKNIDEVDFIELEYGTLATTFNNIKSYSINLETKSLDCVYFTQEELTNLNNDILKETIPSAITLESQVEALQDNVIALKYENLILKGV